MNLSVLVSTMNQKDHSLIKKMNIQTDAIIVNQCLKNTIDEFKDKGHSIKMLSLNERGVGLSRNTAMMRAVTDIVVFADEDEVFVDNYEKIIVEEFEKNSTADVILFNVESLNKNRPIKQVIKNYRVRWFNFGKFGAVRIAARLDSLKENNITFSLLFGGGAKYANGEDSLFIWDCLRTNMRVIASNQLIGYVKQEESSWFNGYNKQFFIGRGVLYKKMFGGMSFFASLVFLIKKHRYYKSELSFWTAFKYMNQSYK